MKLEYTKNGQNYDCESDLLPAVAQAFYMQYGFQQSNGDSFASVVTDVMNEMAEKAKASGHSFPKPKSEQWKALAKSEAVQDAAKPLIHAAILKRIERVNEGKVTARESDPFVTLCRQITVELIRKNAAAKGTKLPDGKSEDYRKLVASVLDGHRVAIEKEANRRLKSTAFDIEL